MSVIDQLNALYTLSIDWDGEGSEPPAKATVHLLAGLLAFLKPHQLPVPHLTPLRDGGVQAEWEYKGRALEIEIWPQVEYLKVFPNGSMEEGTCSLEKCDTLAHWLKDE